MGKRDNFTEKTKRALALRAGHRCSLPECQRSTAGPSDESAKAVAVVGAAAHIHAASPGGPRYHEDMTPEQRKDITNGIWACSTHATLIDRDRTRYSASELRRIKAEHEHRMGRALRSLGDETTTLDAPSNLVQIGPDVVATAVLVSGSAGLWTIRIEHFVRGDLNQIIRYSEGLETQAQFMNFVLSNELGEGRILAGPLRWSRDSEGLVVEVPVMPRPPARPAAKLGRSLALGFDGDLIYRDGRLQEVSGIDAIPQKLYLTLSTPIGEDLFHPGFGSRVAEYHHLFQGTPWLDRFLQLEAIRLSSIPQAGALGEEAHPPLDFIERVRAATVDVPELRDRRLTVRFDLDVAGEGRMEYAIPVVVPTQEDAAKEGPVSSSRSDRTAD